jgi:site-specific DNA-cytosine methylase
MPNFVEWMMGFEEGWTEGVAKTHRLRCLGNAVFVPIAEYLGEQLYA